VTKLSFNCKVSIDKLPPFWDRSAVFVANIQSLFFGNQDETERLRSEVGSLESYGGRLIPILDLLFTRKNNLLVLEKEPDHILTGYFRGLGLTIPKTRVLPDHFYTDFPNHPDPEITSFLEDTRNSGAEWLSGYVIDNGLNQLAKLTEKKLIGSMTGCQRGNNKFLLHQFLVSSNLPTFDCFEARGFKQVSEALGSLLKKGYRYAVVKAQIGASGIGMHKIDLTAPFSPEFIPEYLFYEGPALVQGWLDESVPSVKVIASPSIQLFVDTEVCWLYDLTEQILSKESIHEGNIAPPPCFEKFPKIKDLMIHQAYQVGIWLGKQGYAGTASIDFHAITRKDQIEVRVCEINARVTGATYPAVLAKRLAPQHRWLMRNVRFSSPLEGAKIVEMLKKEGILFLKDHAEGVLPFNFNMRENGRTVKGQFLFLGEENSQINGLIKKLEGIFASHGAYDRD